MRRSFAEAAMSIAAVGLLLLALVAIDPRVRDQVSLRISHPSADLSQAGQQMQDLTTVVTTALRDQSIEHAPMLLFVLTGTVLFFFMIRT
jgi:hypothetical protein